jgi:glycosyltransferase involved in cell wall biosynthesis
MSIPRVSVVIPAYQVTPFIGASLDSVLRQTFINYEILVVNDACPDTPALERTLEPYQGRITYLKHPRNEGPSAARNTAIRMARGELVAFLDGDDEWEPEYLKDQLRALEKDPYAEVVYCDAWVVGDASEKRFMDLCPSQGEVTVQALFRQTVNVMVSALIRKKTLVRVGMMDPAIRCSEDFDLWVRIVQSGGKIIYQRNPLVRHRRRPGSATSNSINMLRGAIAVAEKTLNHGGTREDLETIRGVQERWKAELRLAEGRAHWKEGHLRSAAVDLYEANRYLKQPKLALAALALRWTPRFLGPVARLAYRE